MLSPRGISAPAFESVPPRPLLMDPCFDRGGLLGLFEHKSFGGLARSGRGRSYAPASLAVNKVPWQRGGAGVSPA